MLFIYKLRNWNAFDHEQAFDQELVFAPRFLVGWDCKNYIGESFLKCVIYVLVIWVFTRNDTRLAWLDCLDVWVDCIFRFGVPFDFVRDFHSRFVLQFERGLVGVLLLGFSEDHSPSGQLYGLWIHFFSWSLLLFFFSSLFWFSFVKKK